MIKKTMKMIFIESEMMKTVIYIIVLYQFFKYDKGVDTTICSTFDSATFFKLQYRESSNWREYL